MSDAIAFFLPCVAVPKQGDRTTIMHRQGQKPLIRHHRAPKVDQNAQWLTTLCGQHRPAEPLRGPLQLRLRFQSAYRQADLAKIKRGRGVSPWKDTRPDWDNLAKQICDVLEKCGFFVNDGQLADVHVQKVWGYSPGVSVVLSSITFAETH